MYVYEIFEGQLKREPYLWVASVKRLFILNLYKWFIYTEIKYYFKPFVHNFENWPNILWKSCCVQHYLGVKPIVQCPFIKTRLSSSLNLISTSFALRCQRYQHLAFNLLEDSILRIISQWVLRIHDPVFWRMPHFSLALPGEL